MEKRDSFWFSEQGMRVVNVLFFLALLARNTGFIVVAYLAWIVYLALGARRTDSKALRVAYRAIIAFAAVMCAVNLALLWRALR